MAEPGFNQRQHAYQASAHRLDLTRPSGPSLGLPGFSPPRSVPPAHLPAYPARAQAVRLPGYVQALYDDTTQQLIQAEPAQVLTLQRQGHAIISLADAYHAKLASLDKIETAGLQPKREALLQQAQQLQSQADALALAEQEVVEETQTIMQHMLDRLHLAVEDKLIGLQRDKDRLTHDLLEIDRCIQQVAMLSVSQDQAMLLSQYPELKCTCKRLAEAPQHMLCQVDAQDLQHEAQDYCQLTERYAALTQLLSVKDQIIWLLLKEREARRNQQTSCAEGARTPGTAAE